MNKKFLKVTLVAVVAMIAGVNVFNAQKAEVLSDVAMANVEALADDENSNKTCRWKFMKDLMGCPVYVCLESGQGDPCVCGTEKYV